MDYQVSALDADRFSRYFGQDEETLADAGVLRVIADAKPGFPCRISLQDAEIGESMLLLNYEHQSMPTPFRSGYAIFVREWASQAVPDKNEIPELLRPRLLSVRAFDAAGMLIDADVVEGARLEPVIERMLGIDSVDCLHLHNARPGCYMAVVKRA